MKRWFIVSVLLAVMMLPMVGCATLSGGANWKENVPQLKSNIFLLSKLATRISLTEADMSMADVEVVGGYLVALKDFLAVPGSPNFDGARSLVDWRLPEKYQVYGFTIIDILERYLTTTNLDITEDQELIIAIICSGIDGAIEAVNEFG